MAANKTIVPAVPIVQDNSNISRSDFPSDFIFGSGTAAYQVEGAYAEGGKGLNIWDDLTQRTPSIIHDGSNGSTACDMYHRYKEDIANMKKMGFDSYRFSIAWTRILPGGRTAVGVNREGIDYYNELIDTCIANGLKPFATLFHFDLPNVLQQEYDGFLSRKVVSDFREFAEICFWEFGDRVKFWTTFNEPWTYNVNGYVNGIFPPRRPAISVERAMNNLPAHRATESLAAAAQNPAKSTSDVTVDKSDPAKNVYIAARNMLLAHSAVVQLYRTKYQVYQEGKIGIVLNSHWHVPLDENSADDKAAATRATDFMLGWYLEPVLYGRYPQTMVDFVPPENLAHFTRHEAHMLQGSIDFLGLNYYTANYVANAPKLDGEGYDADQKLSFSTVRDGKPIGDPSGSSWLYIVPWGLNEHLVYLQKTYPGLPEIYITENGVSDKNDPTLTAKEACVDPVRAKFHQDHLYNVLRAIDAKVNVKGYFVWSYCDNFEWAEGYSARFGLMYIDYMNKLTRYPKDSAIWFAKFLKANKQLITLARKRVLDEADDLTANGPEEKRLKALEG